MMKKIKTYLSLENTQCLLLGLLEITLMTHAYSPYPTIEYVLRRDGYFADVSDEKKDKIFSNIYSLVLLFNQCNKIFLGILLDKKGFWVVRGIVHVQQFIGYLLMIIMTPATDYLAYVGVPLVLGSTIGYIFTSIKIIGVLGKENKGIWNSANGAAVSLGLQLYLIYRQLNPSKIFWGILMAFMPISIIRTFFYTPRSNQFKNGIGWQTRYDKVENNKSDNIFRDAIKILGGTPHMWLLFFWFVISDLRSQSYVVMYQNWLEWAADRDEDKIGYYTDVNIFMGLLSIPMSILNGILIDKMTGFLTAKFEGGSKKLTRKNCEVISCFCFQALGLISGAIYSAFLCFPVGWTTYIAILFKNYANLNLFPIRNIFIYCVTDPKLFGSVMGLCNLYALVSAFTSPFFIDILNSLFAGNYVAFELTFAGICLFGVLAPVLNYLWIFRWDKKRYVLEMTQKN